MEVTIKKTYPFDAPFVRVVKPRFMGYKGYITTGGSLCTDVLTTAGWSPCLNIISLMIQLKILIKDAKIDDEKFNKEYTLKEALHHYKHTTGFHHWDKA